MTPTRQNIIILGVGGQGTGLLARALLAAGEAAGFRVKGVQTHGLAQRGGSVSAQIRWSPTPVWSPLIEPHQADIGLGLELEESLRLLWHHLRPQGHLFSLTTSWASLPVRLGQKPPLTPADLEALARSRQAHLRLVSPPPGGLEAMGNIALLAELAQRQHLIPLERSAWEAFLPPLLPPHARDAGMALFGERYRESGPATER